jgi:uncharacterized protein (TIGR02687 family)
MDITRINDALERLFVEEGHRVVFWNDPEHEFEMALALIELQGVNVLKAGDHSALELKIRIEREEPQGKFLLYSGGEEPDFDHDWLLDMRLYGRSFRADRASIILSDLGLTSQHLRQHIADRRKFFDNKDRMKKFQTLVDPNDTATDLDRKMIAVVAKAEQPEWFTIIRTLFHAYTEVENGIEIDLGDPPSVWEQIEKFDLDKPFWKMATEILGYSDENPSLKNLLIHMLVTDYADHLHAELPLSLQHLVLRKHGRANAVVCLAQWRDSASTASSYDVLSGLAADIVHIEDAQATAEIEQLLDVMTFQAAEKALIRGLRNRVVATVDTINVEEIQRIASRRQAGHWASPSIAETTGVPRKAYFAVYGALVAAAEFLALRNQHQQGFDFETAKAAYDGYTSSLFRFDQGYRRFCEAADQAETQSWDVLKKLREQIETCYCNWFLPQLAGTWGKFVDPAGTTALLKRWKIEGVKNQYDFYQVRVKPWLDEAENRRCFVIISDAFRYEAAEELTRNLNGQYRFEADLTSLLSVLPSYTALGMAALLPYKKLGYKDNGDVLVDDKPVVAHAQRQDIMAGVGGMAVKADELTAMKKEEGREFVRGKSVIYIYHNAVDVVGESAASEKDTFKAVRKAIDDLAALVAYVINNLNGNFVLITADHGFLFTETAPGEPEKSKLSEKPAGTIKAKKRYLLGRQLPDNEAVWHGTTAVTAKVEGDMEFWVPRGANRFHFLGSSRFVHGGAMPQEVVVPLITVRHRKDRSVREETKVKTVTVQVLGNKHKITTARHRFELIQMEAVSERVRPITLKVAVYEGTEPVTNIETVTFDSSSANMDDRKKWVSLVLTDRQYDRKVPYRLVLRDAETGVEHQSVDVTIDRAFSDDF